jgi:CxxC-x17-CxxC domain-containing protein
MSEITFFAKTNFRNQETTFGIKTDDRRRHVYVIGKTGMGKTNLLENMIVQDIQNGHGVAYVDPHGDTAEKLIKSIPASRINDVIYFNPADQDYPIAFNVMEKVNAEYRHLIASGLVGVFKKIWADSWGPRLEYILRNAILGLLEYPSATLLGVTRILVDKKYRERVVDKITDPVVKSFWVDEFSKWNDRVLQEVISPIQNKVGQFLSSSLIRNIVGQTKSSFDIREIMDNRKILILNLSKGRIGEDNSALIGAMMITKIQLAAMARVDMPEEKRKDFYLYVDEFQNFATESFANILSEARKYRLNLILANQYITQIEEKVRDAIFGNAGTLVSFRVGAADAEFLEKEYEPIFTANDLVNLPKYNVYLKLMIDGIAGDAFSAITLPPVTFEGTLANEEKVIKVSRERYASSRAEVEDKINRWSGMVIPEVVEKPKIIIENLKNNEIIRQVINKPASQINKQTSEQINRQLNSQAVSHLYPAVCATCGLDIQVPFTPDGQRPTFCKDCLKDYQRSMARSRQNSLNIEDKVKERNKENSKKKIESKDIKNKIEQKAYISQENPLTLSQMQHVAPKKFKQARPKAQINLDELRKLIKENINEND